MTGQSISRPRLRALSMAVLGALVVTSCAAPSGAGADAVVIRQVAAEELRVAWFRPAGGDAGAEAAARRRVAQRALDEGFDWFEIVSERRQPRRNGQDVVWTIRLGRGIRPAVPRTYDAREIAGFRG